MQKNRQSALQYRKTDNRSVTQKNTHSLDRDYKHNHFTKEESHEQNR